METDSATPRSVAVSGASGRSPRSVTISTLVSASPSKGTGSSQWGRGRVVETPAPPFDFSFQSLQSLVDLVSQVQGSGSSGEVGVPPCEVSLSNAGTSSLRRVTGAAASSAALVGRETLTSGTGASVGLSGVAPNLHSSSSGAVSCGGGGSGLVDCGVGGSGCSASSPTVRQSVCLTKSSRIVIAVALRPAKERVQHDAPPPRKRRVVVRRVSQSLRLSHNKIQSLHGLSSFAAALRDAATATSLLASVGGSASPTIPKASKNIAFSAASSLCLRSLRWLDISFNCLKSLPASELAALPELQNLYLHSNLLSSVKELEGLKSLPKLRFLTLMANPVQDSLRGAYRQV